MIASIGINPLKNVETLKAFAIETGCVKWFGIVLMGNGNKREGNYKMKILKHGNLLKFVCENCGCVWTAVKSECRESHIPEPMTTWYWYICPECGRNTMGQDVKAEDIFPN